MKPRALLIDFDGTLVDSISLLRGVYVQFLKEHGVQGSLAEFKDFYGTSIAEMVKTLMSRYGLVGEASEKIRQYHVQVQVAYGQLDLKPGAEKVLNRARSEGIRLAIVTAAQASLVEGWLAHSHYQKYFEAVVTSEGMQMGKPHPAIYLKALNVVGVTAGESLAIEDSHPGVLSALRAGIPTVALGDDFDPNELDSDSRAQLLCQVAGWMEIERVLYEGSGTDHRP